MNFKKYPKKLLGMSYPKIPYIFVCACKTNFVLFIEIVLFWNINISILQYLASMDGIHLMKTLAVHKMTNLFLTSSLDCRVKLLLVSAKSSKYIMEQSKGKKIIE